MDAFRILGAAAALAGALGACAEPGLEEEPPVGHVYACSVEQAWPAVEGAIRDLGYTPVEDRRDQSGGILRARNLQTGTLFVRASVFMNGTTLVSVAAPNGNRDLEEEVLGRIDDELRPKAESPPGIPTEAR